MFAGIKHPELCSIQEIAETYGIRHNHLMKVVNKLSHLGYLETVRGRGGGLRLGRPAEDINLGNVIRNTEGDFRLVECFTPSTGNCCLEPACALKPVLNEAIEQFMIVLDGYVLSDLLKSKRVLTNLISQLSE